MHVPVLLKEVIQYLDPQSNEDFIDATFGEGGHASEILKLTAPKGKLLGIDWDETVASNAIKEFRLDTGSANLKASEPLVPRSSSSEVGLSWSGIEPASFNQEGRLFLEIDNFSDIENISKKYFPEGVNGVLFDFGFRSYHIDDSGRGFSYSKDEPLDMRYSSEGPPFLEGRSFRNNATAADIVNDWPQEELERIFQEYGEERNARRIAKEITEARKQKRIKTTGELVEILDRFSDRSHGPYKTHSKIFQALRIAVNDELENIKKGLEGAWNVLKPDGRLVAISFHSLEDRIVKNFFNEKKQAEGSEFGESAGEGEVLTKKPIMASEEELTSNTRARSAKLRAIKKL